MSWRGLIQQRLTEVLRRYLTQQEAILVEPVLMADAFLGITTFYMGFFAQPPKTVYSRI
jgi:hypothetical protein